MTDIDHHSLSTSALAKSLGMSSQQLFGSLNDYGWIKRVNDSWELTSKGEFEGGDYVHSKKYGRYIVWPQKIIEHPLLQAMEDNRTISAKALGEKYHLSAREVNRVFSELGWTKHSSQGWELTAVGESCGGVQFENEQSGTFYVLWPESIKTHKLLNEQLNYCGQVNHYQPSDDADLLAENESYHSIDGHKHSSRPQLQICHWLYMSGFAHASQRLIPECDDLYADFYLPVQQLYIQYWSEAGNGHNIAQQMKRKEKYKALELNVIELEPKDLLDLDNVLTKSLRKRGIRVY